MLKLTLMLSAAIYAVLVIYSDGVEAPEGRMAAPAASAPVAPDARAALVAAGTAGGYELTTADGRVLQISSVITPSDLTLSDAQGTEPQIAAVSTRPPAPDAPEPVLVAVSAPVEAALPVLEVTASAVNLRSGPSTDTDVIGSLSQGMQAELLASTGDGWVQIRAIATGAEGFMAERFLAPVN